MSYNIDKNVVCLMPWIHTHIWPNGNALLCCMSDSSVPFGNVNDNTLQEILNNEQYKKVRKQMLNGEKPEVCSRCYELETTADTHTLRKSSLINFSKYQHLFRETNKDGSIDDFKMRYMDIRFSNLCNMKCRSCGPDLSSKWYEDHMTFFSEDIHRKKFIDSASQPKFIEDLTTQLPYVEEVYFAGGEVLITPEHYDILDKWLEMNKKDVKLRYTTNFSTLIYKKKNILNYWKTFNDVRVAASLDTFGARAEYLRKGTYWNDIIDNRKKMLETIPEVYFEITPTISVFSVYSLYEFHREWVEKGLLSIDNIRINILTNPRYMSITILPDKNKDEVAKIYGDYITWLKFKNASTSTINSVKGIIDHMYSADNTDLLESFKHNTNQLDKLRKEDYKLIFPELANL